MVLQILEPKIRLVVRATLNDRKKNNKRIPFRVVGIWGRESIKEVVAEDLEVEGVLAEGIVYLEEAVHFGILADETSL